MRHFKQMLQIAAVAIAMITTSAQANTVTGSIWEDQPTGANNATPANVPGTTPDVTFTTDTPINFSADGTINYPQYPAPYTIGGFLQSGSGSTILSGSGELNNTMLNTIFDFRGMVSVTTGETFTVTHDDGLTLVIGGNTVISAPGPTSPTTTTVTYGGPTGNYSFNLVYGECCGPPAVLNISLPLSPVPEPSTYAMLLAGLGLIGFVAYRRKDDSSNMLMAA
jgi:hypothetical protein